MQEKDIFINHGVRKSSNISLIISFIMPCHYDWTTTCDKLYDYKAYIYFYIQCAIRIYEKQCLCKVIQILISSLIWMLILFL